MQSAFVSCFLRVSSLLPVSLKCLPRRGRGRKTADYGMSLLHYQIVLCLSGGSSGCCSGGWLNKKFILEGADMMLKN